MSTVARKTSNLFQTDAEDRASKIKSEVQYSIFLLLPKGEKYEGYMHISFDTSSTEKIFLDYCGDKILSLIVNSQEVAIND